MNKKELDAVVTIILRVAGGIAAVFILGPPVFRALGKGEFFEAFVIIGMGMLLFSLFAVTRSGK